MYLISWLVFVLQDILCERIIDSAQQGGVSQLTPIKLKIIWVAGSPHQAGQNLTSSPDLDYSTADKIWAFVSRSV